MIHYGAGKRIQMLRIKQGLTQSELAEKIHSSQKYISNVETGKKRPSVDFYVTIANFFGVSLDYIFQDSIKMSRNINIDTAIVKMGYMNENEQMHILKLIDTFAEFLNKNK